MANLDDTKERMNQQPRFSELAAAWLEEVPTDGVWADVAAKHVINRLLQ